MIRAIEDLVRETKKDKTYVFLGGPIQGAPDWQNSIPEIDGVEFINPKRSSIKDDFNYNEQVDWETKALRISDIALFWIPKEIESIPGRDYAQTTKIELMENLCRGKTIILGIDEGVHTKRYLELKALKYGCSKVLGSLDECIEQLKIHLRRIKNKTTLFTSDTHFGSQRALTLSRRPFRTVDEMNWTIVERWNKVVNPDDTVFHLGDFGDRSFIKYLNGNIKLLCGNYEAYEVADHWDNFYKFGEALIRLGFSDVYSSTEIVDYNLDPISDIESEYHDQKAILSMNHMPEYLKGKIKDYGLFGHIHGRQKIKSWGIDVGVDSNNFTPMSLDDIRFFISALQRGYYDNNVFY